MRFDIFSIYDLPFLITTTLYLVIAILVFVGGDSNRRTRLYAILCLVTAVWQGLWVVLVGDTSGVELLHLCRIAYSAFIFVPAVLYHFIAVFTRQTRFLRRIYLAYAFSALLSVLTINTNWFINGFHKYPWGLSASAGRLQPLFILYDLLIVVGIWQLFRKAQASAEGTEINTKQQDLVKMAVFIYCGGAIDLVPNYGISMFPLSFLFTGVAVIGFGIAIFRYEFLKTELTPESREDLDRRQAASREMKQLGMAVAFPLVSQGELLGYLLLGEKMSEEAYSKEDLLLLRIVANQAALAYQRVRYLEMAVHGARTEMLGEIAGGFAHEIKTPLANISLPAELSMLDLLDVEKGQKKMEDILPELKERMRDIMQQTVTASEKIEAIRQFSKPGQIRLESVDLPAILKNSLGLLDHLIRKTNTRVRVDLPSTMAAIQGDAKQLEIVFVNLIKNAAEAMTQYTSLGLARELVLKAHEDSNWVVVSVKDSGPGIKRTHIGHLFEAYFTTKGSDGTGMGLFLSRQVIKAHGGAIDVKTEEGKGTEFIIRLPKFLAQTNVHKAA